MEKTGNVNHNHCVKADPQDPLPFCYTTDPNVRFEHCDCDDNQMGSIYPDYNYEDMYNGKSTGNGYGQYGGYRPYGGYGPYSGYGPYGGNSGYGGAYNQPTGYDPRANFGQQGRCRVSTTIKGIIMLTSNS